MSSCKQELCDNWTGQGCACEALDLDKPERILACPNCGYDGPHTEFALNEFECGSCYAEFSR